MGKLARCRSGRVRFETRRGVRVADGDGLENRCSRKGTVGSNPTPSANSKYEIVSLLPVP